MVDTPSADAADAEIERHITLENALNFRDVGGYRTADGRRVRWRRMFRAGGLSNLSPADLAVLRELGIATVLDLRSTAEWESGRFPVDDHPVAFHHLPLVEEILDPTRYEVPEGMLAARYQEIAQIGSSQHRPGDLDRGRRRHPPDRGPLPGRQGPHRGRRRPGPGLARGSRRGGGRGLRASSNLAMAALRERAEASGVPQRRSPAVSDEVFSAKPSNIAALFAALRDAHGSLEDYVISSGVKPAAIESLRAALLE